MLARKNRISKSEFPSSKTKGIRFLSSSFSGVVYPTLSGVKVAVVVSKKTTPKAVDRNLLKRRFYAAFEVYIKKLTKPTLIVVYPKKESIKVKQADIGSELVESLKKTHIL